MPARLGREHPASISQCLPCLFRQYFFQNTIYLFIQLLKRTIIVDDIFRIDAERRHTDFRLEQMILLELGERLGRIIGILAARRETIITPLHIRLDIDEREFRQLPDQIDVRQPADAVDHDQPVLILLDIILYDVGEDTFAEPISPVIPRIIFFIIITLALIISPVLRMKTDMSRYPASLRSLLS